ncbi:MAG: DsbE family thiol:disulfide interchange protein [Rhodobacteraceae bacterium]|nr:DsbE family thiol:disulfide interchange protein [Paracoccaceae bacterium]
MRWLLFVPVAIMGAILGLFLWGLVAGDPDTLPSALAGRAAPPVAAAPLGGLRGFSDADLRDGRVKLVNFWASWCAPCRAEHPNLMALAAEGIPIYGINYKDRPEDAMGFLDSLGDPFRAALADLTGRTGIDWGLYGVPETFVIAGDGTVITRFAGPITERALAAEIRPALARAAGQ